MELAEWRTLSDIVFFFQIHRKSAWKEKKKRNANFCTNLFDLEAKKKVVFAPSPLSPPSFLPTQFLCSALLKSTWWWFGMKGKKEEEEKGFLIGILAVYKKIANKMVSKSGYYLQ